MADELKKPFTEFLQNVLKTPGLSTSAVSKIERGIEKLQQPTIHIPNPEETRSEAIKTIWEIMDNFFEQEPSAVNSLGKIKLHNKNFKQLIDEIETPKPAPKQTRRG